MAHRYQVNLFESNRFKQYYRAWQLQHTRSSFQAESYWSLALLPLSRLRAAGAWRHREDDAGKSQNRFFFFYSTYLYYWLRKTYKYAYEYRYAGGYENSCPTNLHRDP